MRPRWMRALALLGLLLLPLAAADETHADCEKDQPWIGYGSTDVARHAVEGVAGRAAVPCEGEHWDGQDPVQPAQDPGHGASCQRAQMLISPDSLFIGDCMSPDPNNGSADPLAGSGQPAVFRVSDRSHGGAAEAFVAADVWFVARASVYEGACSPLAGEGGLEGDPSCQSGHAQDRSAWYVRDNTPGNLLATLVGGTSLTGRYVGETDCDQATYQASVEQGDRRCARDNTALTLDATLP